MSNSTTPATAAAPGQDLAPIAPPNPALAAFTAALQAGAISGGAVGLSAATAKVMTHALGKAGVSKKLLKNKLFQTALSTLGPAAIRAVLPAMGVRNPQILGILDVMTTAGVQKVTTDVVMAVTDVAGPMLALAADAAGGLAALGSGDEEESNAKVIQVEET